MNSKKFSKIDGLLFPDGLHVFSRSINDLELRHILYVTQKTEIHELIDLKDNLLYAVKITKNKLFHESLNEIEILENLDHPNIIKFIYGYQDTKYVYLITELCTMSLGKLINDPSLINDKYITGLPMKDALPIFKQILYALEYIHSKGIIHLDIKPNNIFICNGIVKLADFGFSVKNKHPSKIIGTPLYISPELLTKKFVKNSTDIWSLGVTFYTILTNCNPFISREIITKKHSQIILFSNIRDGAYSLDEIPEDNPMYEIIELMLFNNPDERPTAEQLLRDFDIFNSEPVKIEESPNPDLTDSIID